MSNTVNHYAPLLAVLASRQCLLASNVFLVFPLSRGHGTLYHANDEPYEIVVYCGVSTTSVFRRSSRSLHLDIRFFSFKFHTNICHFRCTRFAILDRLGPSHDEEWS